MWSDLHYLPHNYDADVPNIVLWDKYEVLPNGCWRSFCKPQATGYIRVCKRRNGKNVMFLPAPHLLRDAQGADPGGADD